MNYYEETLAKIKELMTKQQYDEALRIVTNELKMPYVPKEFEKQLLFYQQELFAILGTNQKPELTGKELFAILNNEQINNDEKVGLFYQLEKFNLRNYLSEIKEFFNSNASLELKTILIYLLASQDVDQEFTYHGLQGEIKLNPKTFDFQESERFVEQLNDQLANDLPQDYPQLLEMAKIVVANLYYKLFPLLQTYDLLKLSQAIKNRLLIVNGIKNNPSDDQQILDYEKLLISLKIV
jgi:hypothetical protein